LSRDKNSVASVAVGDPAEGVEAGDAEAARAEAFN
jgi:hypothetical protein